MPEISSDKTTAVTYPPKPLYDQWSDHADALDMSISQFIIRMVAAGRTNISMEDASSESVHDLLQQQELLERKIERQREQIQDLERQLQFTPQAEIVDFVKQNPGADSVEIMQHIADTVPGRVASHLDMLEGDVLEVRDAEYYCREDAESASQGEGE